MIILRRACIHGGLGTPTASQPNIFDSEKLSQIFLVLLVGFEPLGLWISSLTLYQQCNPTTLTCGESWKGTEAKREGEEHIAWTQDSNPKSLYPVKCHHHSPMTPPGHTHVPVITTFALSLLKIQEYKTVNAGRSHSQTHDISTHLVRTCFSACEILAWLFLMRWPSSQIIRSGPGLTRAPWMSKTQI